MGWNSPKTIAWGAAAFFLLALLLLIAYATRYSFDEAIAVVGAGGALLLGAVLAGTFLGMLFGIPRSLTGDSAFAVAEDQRRRLRYAGNANLEQVSDWLTKVLIGVGLSQLFAIPGAVGDLIDYVRPGFEQEPSRAFVLGLLMYAFFGGFILAYLVTRLYLPRLFSIAETEATRDVAAVTTAESQLQAGTPNVAQDVLVAAFAAASPSATQEILQKALKTANEPDGAERAAAVIEAVAQALPKQNVESM